MYKFTIISQSEVIDDLKSLEEKNINSISFHEAENISLENLHRIPDAVKNIPEKNIQELQEKGYTEFSVIHTTSIKIRLENP